MTHTDPHETLMEDKIRNRIKFLSYVYIWIENINVKYTGL